MTRSLALAALCGAVNEATLRLDCIWTEATDAVDTPADSVQAWHCTLEGARADASGLWLEILRPFQTDGIQMLRGLAPVREADGGAYASVTLFHLLPGLEFDNAALSFMGEHGRCYCCQWGSTDIPACPDLEIVSESFGGLSVRWSPRAERWLHVSDAVVCHAVRAGADMGIEEEED